ncbi:MAG: LysR family transcriptional regulator [Atopobiaceae bacterium]|nr:LysR family transcriptional regulator [Atopobiaceae bacterium]
MTLQQLKYVVEVATRGSISSAAASLYIAQPSLSKAIATLEQELGITIFQRSARGIQLTEEGNRFLAYARQVVDNIDLLEARYVGPMGPRRTLCVSCPHETHFAQLFAELVREVNEESFEFVLREVPATVVLEDVRQQRSELGIIYCGEANRERLMASVHDAGLHYAAFTLATPYIVVRQGHPLAKESSVDAESLAPYPRIMLEWVSYTRKSFGSSLAGLPSPNKVIRTTDRQTQQQLVEQLDGYMFRLAVDEHYLEHDGMVTLPLDSSSPIEVGLLTRPGIPLSPLAQGYKQLLLGE